jgi:hypothetical protein
MKKRDLVEKIAKEQNLDINDLMRLPVEELRKMDAVVPDENEEGDEVESEEPTSAPTSEEPTPPVVAQVETPVEGKRMVGYHPITKEPVYV